MIMDRSSHGTRLLYGLSSTAKWSLEVLRPSVLTRSTHGRKQQSRMAYLDGLRGFMAFLVYWQHYQLWVREVPSNRILENAYGFEGKYHFATIPGIRTFFTGGHFAVAVFFVISGYVLSAKSLSLIYAGNLSDLASTLGSALFRRWMRLHIPVILITFVYMTSWHAFGIWTQAPVHKGTYLEELFNWYDQFGNFSYVFRSSGVPWFDYDFPAWSIPVEFRGSIVVYTVLLAFAKLRKNARLWCQVGLVYYFLYICDGWSHACFIFGMLLCELDLLAKYEELPTFIARLATWKRPIAYVLFLVATLLSGVPSHFNDPEGLKGGPGWYYMAYLKPRAVKDQKFFYLSWAAVLFVGVIPHISWLKKFFEMSFNQYLGRISFALYLVHGPVIWILGDRFYPAVGWYKEPHQENVPQWIDKFPLSKDGPLGLEPSFLLPQLILLPFTLWLSEVATKLCDESSVRFSQWAYSSLLQPAPTEPMVLHNFE